MFANSLIDDDSFASDPDGFRFDLRLNWYRGLPLSSVARLEVRVDGEPVDPRAILFTVDGVTRRLAALPELDDEWWFVADPAEIRVARAGGLAPGAHELEVTLGTRIPYIVIRDADVLTEENTCRKSVRV